MSFGQFLRTGLISVLLFFALDTLGSTIRAATVSYQGFGADTPGGEGQPIYRVTNLNDSGPGSLRNALSQGNRYIVFDVAGEIELPTSRIAVNGANITIDGFTAPPPGITIKNRGLTISGGDVHDIIVRGIRVNIAHNVNAQDGISVGGGAHNVVIDHVSIRGASDESIGINNAYDVTVSWSLLAEPIINHNANMLIFNQAKRLSIHHNLFIKAQRRNPWVHYSDFIEAPEIQVDVRNNVMWDVSGSSSNHGTVVFAGGKANIVDNYYNATAGLDEDAQKRVIVICKGSATTPEDMSFCQSRLQFPPARAYVAGNVSGDGWTDHINTKGTETTPFLAPLVDTTDACTAAHQVLADAGVTQRDIVEQNYLSAISLPGCGGSVEPTLTATRGELFFAAFGGSNPSSQTLAVSETSDGVLPWSATTDVPWLSVSPVSGTTPSKVSVAVKSSGLPVGSHQGTISIAAPDAMNSPVLVPVTFTVLPVPQITAPTPGSVLPGSSVTFKWTANGANVQSWQLYVGSSRGARDLYASGQFGGRSTTSKPVSRLPTDGRTVWVQLRFKIGGSWQFADFQYTAFKK